MSTLVYTTKSRKNALHSYYDSEQYPMLHKYAAPKYSAKMSEQNMYAKWRNKIYTSTYTRLLHNNAAKNTAFIALNDKGLAVPYLIDHADPVLSVNRPLNMLTNKRCLIQQGSRIAIVSMQCAQQLRDEIIASIHPVVYT